MTPAETAATTVVVIALGIGALVFPKPKPDAPQPETNPPVETVAAKSESERVQRVETVAQRLLRESEELKQEVKARAKK